MRSVCKAKALSGIVLNEVDRFEDKFSRFKSTSITSQINREAGSGSAVSIDQETATLLGYADALYEQSDGMFDITSGVLRKVWDFKSSKLPSERALTSVLGLISWRQVNWDDSSVSLTQKGMEIDFGGFVKEYIADVISTICLNEGVRHGLVNLGGDVRIVGPHPDGEPWRVGIQHPRLPGESIAHIDIVSGGIATSGDYERFMFVDGKRYCHLLNPKNGMSIQPKLASVSVVAESCLVAGSFSTLAMLNSAENDTWLASSGLPYLQINLEMEKTGVLQ